MPANDRWPTTQSMRDGDYYRAHQPGDYRDPERRFGRPGWDAEVAPRVARGVHEPVHGHGNPGEWGDDPDDLMEYRRDRRRAYPRGRPGLRPDYGVADTPYDPSAFPPALRRRPDAGPRRDWWDRARDEVASWFGDDDAEARRRMDHAGLGPKDYRRSDGRIYEDVCDWLTDDPGVDASGVTVTVADGEVTLAGSVPSRAQKRRAEDLADRVSGVMHVQNNLRVPRAVAERAAAVDGGTTPAAPS